MKFSLLERLQGNGNNTSNIHTPDVLSCLANLSNDEVFTPPEIVNQMLDMLPQDLFKDPNTKFLDPACKTGVFLREIAKRLLVGLEPIYPDLQERIDHIFHNQLYGIAITELTSLLSRRSLYCSKYPNGQYSISNFDNAEGNIRFKKIEHTWEKNICKYCGASKTQYDRNENLETHAYEFIHSISTKEVNEMKFDVIISNPPYQLSDGGGTGSSAMPIYQHFVEQAMKLSPRYLTMIIPSRWFVGGKGLDEFRSKMLNDKRITKLVDYQEANMCFPGVQIEGGVCYFLWDRDNESKCNIKTISSNNVEESCRYLLEEKSDVYIRWNKAISIYKKVCEKNEDSFADIISTRKPFGLSSNFKDFSERKSTNSIKIYANKTVGYINKNKIPSNTENIKKWKVYISFAYGYGNSGFPHQIINKPFVGEPDTCCTETYLLIGPFKSKKECDNCISYICTKFFRFLVLLRKSTQNATQKVYQFVPIQDFNNNITDAELYKKYNLTKDEIDFIESMIKPMEI